MKDLQLYIGNEKADLSGTLDLTYVYQITDVQKPQAIKNNFSKTFSLFGTKQNNKIFSQIYNFDSIIFDFDPSIKTPAVITLNGDIIEQGYLELNSIDRLPSGDIQYNVTIYGGLGDFFYNLSYDEDGNEKTLADIRFFLTDDKGNLIEDHTKEMDFNINKEFVYSIWDYEQTFDDKNIRSIINFIPCYNGKPEGDFNADKCVINTNGQSIFPSTATNEGTTYRTIDGYALASLENDYNEWQMCDLRSYNQRPAIRLQAVIEAICNPANNGGYDVKLDEAFFNFRNPYWSSTYIALPMLNTSLSDIEMAGGTIDLRYSSGSVSSSTRSEVITTLSDSNSRTYVDMSRFEGYNKITVDIPVSISATVNGTTQSSLYMAYGDGSKNYTVGAIGLQLVIENTSGTVLGGSPVYIFGNKGGNGGTVFDPNTTANYINEQTMYNFTPRTNKGYVNIFGNFVYNSGRYIFQNNDRENTFVLSAECNVPNNFVVKIYRYVIGNKNYMSQGGNNIIFYNRNYQFGRDPFVTYTANVGITGHTSGTVVVTPKDTAASNIKITKRILLSSDITPCKWLLSFCKLFGLYLVKDKYSKTISILTRDSFYSGDIIDLSSNLDYSKTINIDPLYFENKWLNFTLDTPETNVAKRYKSLYGAEYGDKKQNTNYNFNADSQDIFEDNVFQNVITGLDSNRLFRIYKNSTRQTVPSFLVDNCDYTLYSSSNDEYEQTIYGSKIIRKLYSVEWNAYTPGADIIPKPFLYSGDDTLEEIKASLFFDNGSTDLIASNDEPIDVVLSDDLPVMYTMGVSPCWIWSKSNDVIHLDYLPSFTRYLGTYYLGKTLDFGKPKEIYVDGNYLETDTLYDQFWKSYYTDLTDKNCKRVTAYVKFDTPIQQDMLRNFYIFEHCLWVLNKVEIDYLSENTTKCEFLKVASQDAYTNGLILPIHIWLEDEQQLIPWNGGKNLKVYVYTNDPELTITYAYSGFTNYKITQSQDNRYKWELTFDAVTSPTPYNRAIYSITVRTSNGITRAIPIGYEANLNTMTYVYGVCTRAIEGISVTFTYDGVQHTNYVSFNGTTQPQNYRIYIPKQQTVTIKDFSDRNIITIGARSNPYEYNIK